MAEASESTVAQLLRAAEAAMTAEGIDGAARARVINRLIYGDPLGPRARHRIREEERQISITVNAAGTPADLTAVAQLQMLRIRQRS